MSNPPTTFLEAAEVTQHCWGHHKMDAGTNSAMRHFYEPEPMPLMSHKRIDTPVFRVGQLHDPYFRFYKEDEDQRERDEVFKVGASNSSPKSYVGSNNTSNGKDPLAFAIRRKRERKKRHALKVTKKLFKSLSKHMADRSNKLNNKGHLCLKWYSAIKAQRVQHLVKQIDPEPPTPPKLEEADLMKTLDWMIAPCKFWPWIHWAYGMSMQGEFTACHKRPSKYKDNDNFFQQDWFLGMYNQFMTRHCPEWVDEEPTCARNFAAAMEFPIFAGDIKKVEESALSPSVPLGQPWESPSTIDSKATWDRQSHENPCFIGRLYGGTPQGLGEDLISTI
eukprot:jgi/Psemu1/40168/gm1.40168_g